MANDTKRVGWIGLGDLGGAMARRIQSQGVGLAVYDIDQAAVRRLTAMGAKAASSIRELGQRSDIVMLSLPHPAVLDEVVLGADGLIHALAPASIVCDTSTNGRDAVLKVGASLAEKGIRMVEGPIGKGPWAAEKGELTIMMGGDRETLREVEFLFRLIGSELYYCGPLGAGQVVKVANNLASCANLAVAAEAYALAAAGGADLDVVTKVMPQTAADSWQLRNSRRRPCPRQGRLLAGFQAQARPQGSPARGGFAAEPGTAERLRQGRARLVRPGPRRRPRRPRPERRHADDQPRAAQKLTTKHPAMTDPGWAAGRIGTVMMGSDACGGRDRTGIFNGSTSSEGNRCASPDGAIAWRFEFRERWPIKHGSRRARRLS